MSQMYQVQNSIYTFSIPKLGFPDSSVGKESTCNAGDLSLIPGLGRSPGGGVGYQLQCFRLENSMDRSLAGKSMGLQRVGYDLATKQLQSAYY